MPSQVTFLPSLRDFLAFLIPLIACSSASEAGSRKSIDPYSGLYASADGSIIELHRGPEGARGYMRSQERVAALAPIETSDSALTARATYEDRSTDELRMAVMPGPVIMLDGRAFRRSAVEKQADATVRREIEAAYAKLAAAVESKNYDAFQATRVAEFATIPPDGVPSPGSRMAERARGMLERIQPPITTTNDILDLKVRGNDAIATVRQKFTRTQLVEGTSRAIHTEVTQRETWTRTPDGWKLLFVDEVRDHLSR